MAGTQTLLDPEFMNRLEQLSLVSRKVFTGKIKGERRSKKKGVSVEFADYKNYTHGDDLRFLDWNIYGRLDKLFLKLFMEEEDLRVYILVDTSRSMLFGEPVSKFDFARKVAAAIAYIGLCNLDRVAVRAFAGTLEEQFRPTRGKRQVWKLFEFLDGVKCDGTTSLRDAFKRFVIEHRGKGIVVVISDFLDKESFEEGMKYLLYNQMDVFVMHVLADEEVNPPFNGDLKLVDAEDGDIAEVSMSASVMKAYQRTVNSFCNHIRTYCSRNGFNYLFTTSGVPFDQLVLNYLRKVGLTK